MSTSASLATRAIAAVDASAAHAVLEAALTGSAYLDRAREVIGLTLPGGDREHRALVATRGAQLVGIAAFGELPGSDGVMRIHVLALRDRNDHDTARGLAEAVSDIAREMGTRFVFCELADDDVSRHTIKGLEAAGYHEETRIADYVRDGVSMVFLRHDL